MSDVDPNILVFNSANGGAGQTALSAHVALGLARSGRNVLFVELQTPSAAAPYLSTTEPGDSLPVPVALGSLSAATVHTQDCLWHVVIDAASSDKMKELHRLASSKASRGLWIVIDVPRHLDVRRDLALEPDVELRVLRADPAALVDAEALANTRPEVRLILNQIDHRRPISLAIDRVLGTLLEDRLVARVHYDEAVAESLASRCNVFDFAPSSSAARTFSDLVQLMIASEPAGKPIIASRSAE